MESKGPVFRASVAIVATGLVLLIVLPVIFFVSLSFFSGEETYQFPQNLFPKFSYSFRIEYIGNKYKIDVWNTRTDEYDPLLNTSRMADIMRVMRRQYSYHRTAEQLEELFAPAKEGMIEIVIPKDMFYNYSSFFTVTQNAQNALPNSLMAAGWTILISLSIGSLSGYALARYRFPGRNQINLTILVVRMFPTLVISIPLAVDLITFGLFDTMLGLAIVYSIPNIALTSWITYSIFLGISVELEEAALVFGATPIRKFFNITLPLAFPGIAACSMYAFLAAWNDMLTALILTNNQQTLALVIYKTLGGSNSMLQIAAAGCIILVIPALVFTFVIKNYIGQMWGQVRV